VPTNQGTFKLLAGELKVYVKTAESGNKRVQAFCPNCGTQIYAGPMAEGPTVVALRVGTIRQRDHLIPSDQYWFRSAQTWLGDLEKIKRRETQPVFDAKGGVGR